MWTELISGARLLGGLFVTPADGHCDTEDGPAVIDGRRALASGNVNLALKWVRAEDEDEVRAAFAPAIAYRAAGGADVERAERGFLETLVRVHRAGEGERFDGIKPGGTELPAEVVAADRALDQGTIAPLQGLVPDQRWPELERRFREALAHRDFDVDDLGAARQYVQAYTAFLKYAEGHDTHHAGHHHR